MRLPECRFPAPRNPRDHRTAVMSEIEKQATNAWGSNISAIAAWDFMRIVIPATTTNDASLAEGTSMFTPQQASSSNTTDQAVMELQHANPVEGFLYTNNRHYDDKSKKRKL